VVDLRHGNRRWRLVNLFAANDPDSTFKAMDGIRSHLRLDGDSEDGRPVALFVSRRDRAARSSDFAPALSDRQGEFARIVLWGQNTRAVARAARAHGVDPALLVDAGSMAPESLTRLLLGSLDGRRVVVGMGNILGDTQAWLEHLSPYVERTIA
jgi:hypothetical protein